MGKNERRIQVDKRKVHVETHVPKEIHRRNIGPF